MNIQVPKKVGNFLSSWAAVNFLMSLCPVELLGYYQTSWKDRKEGLWPIWTQYPRVLGAPYSWSFGIEVLQERRKREKSTTSTGCSRAWSKLRVCSRSFCNDCLPADVTSPVYHSLYTAVSPHDCVSGCACRIMTYCTKNNTPHCTARCRLVSRGRSRVIPRKWVRSEG
jgi:hypothetical protein